MSHTWYILILYSVVFCCKVWIGVWIYIAGLNNMQFLQKAHQTKQLLIRLCMTLSLWHHKKHKNIVDHFGKEATPDRFQSISVVRGSSLCAKYIWRSSLISLSFSICSFLDRKHFDWFSWSRFSRCVYCVFFLPLDGDKVRQNRTSGVN